MNDAVSLPLSRFELALSLAHEGRLEESLESWNLLIADLAPPRLADTPARELGAALLQRAWVLLDLRRYAEARTRFEAPLMRTCVDHLPASLQFEYWFSYGNTLGELGLLDPMDQALGRALHLAATELGDTDRCVYVWMNLIHYARRMGAWRYVMRACETAWGFARHVGMDWLQTATRGAWAAAVARLQAVHVTPAAQPSLGAGAVIAATAAVAAGKVASASAISIRNRHPQLASEPCVRTRHQNPGITY